MCAYDYYDSYDYYDLKDWMLDRDPPPYRWWWIKKGKGFCIYCLDGLGDRWGMSDDSDNIIYILSRFFSPMRGCSYVVKIVPTDMGAFLTELLDNRRYNPVGFPIVCDMGDYDGWVITKQNKIHLWDLLLGLGKGYFILNRDYDGDLLFIQRVTLY